MALPLNSWGDFLKILRQLKDPKAKAMYETIVIDTADIAYAYCEKYICAQHGVESIGKIPFGQGYNHVANEFDSKVRSIVQEDYGVVLISHAIDKQFTDENGIEYQRIVSTLPNKARTICSRMCDIIGYSRTVHNSEGALETRLYMRGTPRFEAGSRFRYTPDSIIFSYENLVAAIGDAIDKQAAEGYSSFVTETRVNINKETETMDFDALMTEFKETTTALMSSNPEYFGPRIVEIVERHIGKGAKVAEMSRDQVQLLDIIMFELRELA